MNRALVYAQGLILVAALVSGGCHPSGSESGASRSESIASVTFKVDGMT